MTVATTATKQQTTGDGVTLIFPFSFGFSLNAQIKVILSVIATGVETVQTEGANYTLAGVDTDAGTVTMIVAPAATERLTIYLDPDPTQSTNFRIGDSFPSDAIEESLDLSIRVNQRGKHVADRALVIKESDLDDSASTYDAQSRRIINLADAINPQDAVTSADLAAAVLGGLVNVTITGTLDVTGAVDFASTLQVDGNATVGGSGVSGPELNISSLLNTAADLVWLNAGTETWRLGQGVAQEFTLENPNGNVLFIEATANANSLYIDADGHIGIGQNPTATFDFINSVGDTGIYRWSAGANANNFQLDADAAQNVDLAFLSAASTAWILRKEDVANNFEILSPTNIAVTIEAGAIANALYIDADGHIGFGADPGAGFDLVLVTGAATFAKFESTLAGGTVHLNLRNGTQSWEMELSGGTGGFQINDDTGSTSPFFIGAGTPTNRLQLDSTGIGVFTATPVAQQTVTGSRAGNAALASLLTAMANFGWIVDSSTA